MSKVCWDSQTLAFQGPVAMHYWEHSLQLLFYKLSLEWGTMAPEGHWAQALPDPDLGSYKVTNPH